MSVVGCSRHRRYESEIIPDSIESITVQSFAKALLLGRTAPENPVAAMYSIPYAIGCKLIKGQISPKEILTIPIQRKN
ncbi:MAG: MmgE/PrpD family protein [bacterium]|nr:MmgE/PrpD family protein [bacterium]